jgi:hypothetical protein
VPDGPPAPGGSDLARHITVASSEGAHGSRTVIRIDHRVPDPASGRRARWHVTTRAQFLPSSQFDEAARARVANASAQRGRALCCIDLDSGQVIAALSYHVDERPRHPVLLTAVAMRIDGEPELSRASRGCAALLKQYVHAIAALIGRASYIDIDAPNRAQVLRELEQLGFRPAPRLRGFEPGGVHLRQLAQTE